MNADRNTKTLSPVSMSMFSSIKTTYDLHAELDVPVIKQPNKSRAGLVEHQRSHRIERIEEEVRVDLARQSVEAGGYRFALHSRPRLHAIQAALLSFTVTRPNGAPAHFTPWFGALAHAIFFRAGTLDYFHTHVCAPGASGCTSTFGAAKVTGTSSTPGKLSVGVLVPVAGTWRLFLQCQVDGRVLTAPFTLHVR